jgi:hypothetical protein
LTRVTSAKRQRVPLMRQSALPGCSDESARCDSSISNRGPANSDGNTGRQPDAGSSRYADELNLPGVRFWRLKTIGIWFSTWNGAITSMSGACSGACATFLRGCKLLIGSNACRSCDPRMHRQPRGKTRDANNTSVRLWARRGRRYVHGALDVLNEPPLV